MRKTLVLIAAATFLSYCSEAQTTYGINPKRLSKRKSVAANSSSVSDTIQVSGTQYLPVLGKSESGTRADLAGTWILQSMGDEATERGNTGIKNSMNNDARRDSSIKTKTINRVTQTTTEVQINKSGNPEKRITPSQSSNYHITEKPGLSFYGSNENFAGFTGCNRIAGRYTVTGNSINFENAAPSTKMVCIGAYDENAFLHALHRINSFKATSYQLQLMEGDNVLLVFTKKQ